jgi:lipooligosaccharide transport system permease protein
MTLRCLYLVERNFLVWRKLIVPSLTANLADPLLYLVGFGFGVGSLIGAVDGQPYIQFLAGGMVCYSTLNSATAEALYSAFSRLKMQRTWEGILHAPMTVTDVVVGEWIWAALKALLSGTAILLIMYALGLVSGWRPLAVLPVLLLLGLCVAGLALIMTTIAKSFDFFVYYFTMVLTPMSFLSGIFFPLHALPPLLQKIAMILPLTHGALMARGLLFGAPIPHPAVSLSLLALYGLTGVLVSSRIATRRLTR